MGFKIKKKENGFTLVELAIVLIIIGLITGGVVGAQSLIESSKRASLISDFGKIKTGISAFRLEYDGIPGDFKDANSYWSDICDGNGDGVIGQGGLDDSQCIADGSTEERDCVWVAMVAAEIMDNFGPKVNEAKNISCSRSGTIFSSPYGGVGYFIFSNSNSIANYSSIGYSSKNILAQKLHLTVGAPYNGSRSQQTYTGGFMQPSEAKKIDSKIDDGRANEGFFFSGVGSQTTSISCVSGGGGSTIPYDYDLTSEEYGCVLVVRLD